ncbi:MAG: hypothetical protein E6Q50_02745 [Lysobacter sp.]|nr:MAG: hypothetical protein E6Q50_02745 [Lysobacter sp.]
MADASHPFEARRHRPRDWGEALSALPLETPPLSVWTQIEARLGAADRAAHDEALADPIDRAVDDASRPQAAPSAHPRRRRGALPLGGWMALAAAVSALAVLPALWFVGREGHDDRSPTVARAQNPASPSETASPAERAAAPTTASTSDAARVAAAAVQVASTVPPRARASEISAIPTDRAQAPDLPTTPQTIHAAPTPGVPQIASVAPQSPSPSAPSAAAQDGTQVATNVRDTLPPGAVLVGDVDADVTGSEMEMLYAASAQLETLLTYTHDPRVESGPAAALASQIHTRLAKIDARLAMPGLSDDEQHALWRARVGTLRQALAFESEQRALAAEGQTYEGELVEVY